MSSNILNSSVLGMAAQANWLASISQNVANSSTTGYKDAETEFSALVDEIGGTNTPGLGVATSNRSLNSLQGSLSGASSVTDLAIQGNGYFVVSDTSGASGAPGNIYLTRAGAFVPDSSGNLVNAAGYYLMGTNLQTGAFEPVNVENNASDPGVSAAQSLPVPTTAGTLAVNLPSTATAVNAADTPGDGGSTYTAKTSLIAYDDSGSPVTLDVYMTKLANSSSGDPQWQVAVYDSANAASGGGFPYAGGPLATQTLNFDPTTGQMAGGSSLSIAVPGGQTMSLDMSASTQLASAFNVNSALSNGSAPSSMTGMSVGADGTLSFLYSSGTSFPAYSIPLANVVSPDSMTSLDGTAFSANGNSGQMQMGVAGSGGLGSIQSSSLENSTVDLATQLTSMIQAQSGYQANSKVFQAGDDIINVLNRLGE
jgi:flagellar hook protein FlgE